MNPNENQTSENIDTANPVQPTQSNMSTQPHLPPRSMVIKSMEVNNKYKSKAIFWNLVFPWLLLSFGLVISTALYFVSSKLGGESVKTIGNIISYITIVVAFIWLVVGLIRFIIISIKKS